MKLNRITVALLATAMGYLVAVYLALTKFLPAYPIDRPVILDITLGFGLLVFFEIFTFLWGKWLRNGDGKLLGLPFESFSNP